MNIRQLIRQFTQNKNERRKLLREIYEFLIFNKKEVKDSSKLTLKFFDSDIYQKALEKVCNEAFDFNNAKCLFCGGKVRVLWNNSFPLWSIECEKCGMIYDED